MIPEVYNIDMFRRYPYNVVHHAICDNFDDPDLMYRLYVPGLWNAIQTLNEREQRILTMRFDEYKTLDECGKEFGVTRERIRQIEAHALRVLMGKQYMFICETPQKSNRLKMENELLRGDIEKLKARIDNYITSGREEALESECPVQLQVPIEFLDLTVRSFNILRRAGYVSVGQLIGIKREDILKFRNAGERTADEVLEKLNKYLEESGNKENDEWQEAMSC